MPDKQVAAVVESSDPDTDFFDFTSSSEDPLFATTSSCQSITAEGSPCRHPAIPGTSYCKGHSDITSRALEPFKHRPTHKKSISTILLNTRRYLKSTSPEDVKGEVANMRAYRDWVQDLVTKQDQSSQEVDMDLVVFVNKLNVGIVQAVQALHNMEYARQNVVTQKDLSDIIEVLINIARRTISDEAEFINFAEEVRAFLLGVSTGRSRTENSVA